MNILKRFLALILISILLSGCTNPIYINNIEKKYSMLKVGMSRQEFQNLFANFRFIKEQTVDTYPNSTVEDMRLSLKNYKTWQDVYPQNLINELKFDGSIRVYSYLIKKRLVWPNGWIVYYVAVFFDENSDKVIGWAKMSKWGDLKNWSKTF